MRGFFSHTPKKELKHTLVRRVLQVLVVLLILGVSYLRQTYLFVPNVEGNTWLIPVNEKGTQTAIVSMAFYFAVFGILYLLFSCVFFPQRWRKVLLLYGGLVFVSAVFFGLFRLTSFDFLFAAGSMVKNFLLSPVYPFVVYAGLVYQEKKTKGDGR